MSNGYEFTGRIKTIGPTQSFGANNFLKREIVVCDENARFPQDIAFSFVKDRCSVLDAFHEGDLVKISFDIRGREYNGRHFVDLSGWRIERADSSPGGGAAAQPQSAGYAPPASQPAYAQPAPAPIEDAAPDNLPF